MAGEALEQSGHAVAEAAAAKDKAAEADKKATKALQVSGMLLDFKKSMGKLFSPGSSTASPASAACSPRSSPLASPLRIFRRKMSKTPLADKTNA